MKTKSAEMISHFPVQPADPNHPLALESEKNYQSNNTHVVLQSLSLETDQLHSSETHIIANQEETHEEKNEETIRLSLKTKCDHEETISTQEVEAEAETEDNGRERLKRHRRKVAGRVWIPDIWGQEDLLKNWIDCSSFDACLFPSGILSARAALVQEGR